jgi:hypothetical protein
MMLYTLPTALFVKDGSHKERQGDDKIVVGLFIGHHGMLTSTNSSNVT